MLHGVVQEAVSEDQGPILEIPLSPVLVCDVDAIRRHVMEIEMPVSRAERVSIGRQQSGKPRIVVRPPGQNSTQRLFFITAWGKLGEVFHGMGNRRTEEEIAAAFGRMRIVRKTHGEEFDTLRVTKSDIAGAAVRIDVRFQERNRFLNRKYVRRRRAKPINCSL